MTVANYLGISGMGKGIPYGGSGEIRPDGDANYGFKNLKAALDLLEEIPELARDPALRELVRTVNGPSTGLLTIGCVSAPIRDESGHRMSGYVEFAFNSKIMVSDATHYFPIFFHFDNALRNSALDQIHFYWELMGADFLEENFSGFTISVTVNTGHFATPHAATECWKTGIDFLGLYLNSIPPQPGGALF